MTLPIVEQLRELAEHNRRHFPSTREEGFIALGDEAADTIGELVEALSTVRAYYFLANPTKLTEAQVCDMVCTVLAKIGGDA